MFDYKQLGYEMWHYEIPPKIPDKEEVLVYEDALKEILETKVRELIEHMDLLEKERKEDLDNIKKIKKEQNIDKDTEYFLSLWAETKFAETQYIQKWVRYWMKIRDIVMHTDEMERIDEEERGVTERDIERAKTHPIEDLFEGRLRHSGARFTGVCPFHKENTGSFVIFTNDNTYHCFGCGEHGDSIDFMMKTRKIKWAEAVWSLL